MNQSKEPVITQLDRLVKHEYMDPHEERQAVEEYKLLKSLLEVAKCPACDGSGNIPNQISEDDWEAIQCQWCAERKGFLETKLREK